MTLPFEYKLTRKKVKNINCRIKSDGIVYVSANRGVSKEYIEQFLLSKQDVILDAISKASKKKPLEIIDNNIIKILGKNYTIKIINSDLQKISISGDYLIFETYNYEVLQDMLDHFAKEYCKKVCTELSKSTFEMLSPYNIPMPTIKYRKMKSMWGNCNKTKKTITFSTNLIFTNYDFVKYVVLHEFVHLIHPHHQKEFYDIIKIYMPDYKSIKGNLYD